MVTRRQMLFGTLLLAAKAQAQQLAHAGWRGNGIAPEAWWQHAAMIRFPNDITFADAAKFLDRVSEVSADSILLPDLRPTATQPFAEQFGTEDALDELLRETSARRMHVLLGMPLQRAISNPGEVRFWMSRGISGIDLGTLGSGDIDAAQQLRSALDRYPGKRILLARTPNAAAAPATTGKHKMQPAMDPITLHILSPQDAESGAPRSNALTAVEITALPETEGAADSAAEQLPGSAPELRSLMPLLLAPGAPILDSRILATASGRSSVQQVLALRNTHVVVRSGMVTVLQTSQPALRAWLLRSRSSRETLLLATNEGTLPVTLHLTSALAANGIRRAYLRPLLRSDHAMGSVNVEEGVLPPASAILADIRSD